MQTVLTDKTISMSDFKRNPTRVLREAGSAPVAVLNHNKPAFYMLEPKLFEALLDAADDALLIPLLQRRIARADFVEVSLDEL